MNRKILCAILILALCFSLAVCAHAETVNFVMDEDDYLDAFEITDLNELAASVYERTGIGIFFAFTQTDPLSEYDIDSLVGGFDDYVVMLENATHWNIFYGGKCESIDEDQEAELRAAYDEAETYAEGVEAFLYATAECFGYIENTAEGNALDGDLLLYDGADLLSVSEELALNEKLSDLSQTHNAQIVIITMESANGGDIDEILESTYDDNGFGYGVNKDGVLLLLCMDIREYRVLSNGFAGWAIDSGDIDRMGDAFVSDLTAGFYADAFNEFADQCDYYLDGYLNGYPFEFGKNLLTCLVIGLVVGLIVSLCLKGQLKSVRKQNRADVYVKPGSLQISVCHDFFLYRNVVKTKKETKSSGSGSGSSRSTGGGKF